MEQIRKTGHKNTYFKGSFYLRNKNENWASPIDFPTVFIAKGRAVKSGNWDSCTSINTPKYVIENFFDGNKNENPLFWESVFNLESITWEDVKKDKNKVLNLINLANNQLLKFRELD